MPQLITGNSPMTSTSVSNAFNASQQNATSSSGSHSGPDIYTATLQNTDYTNALDFHQQNYNNILAGYTANAAGLNPYVQSIGAGYGALNQNVQNQLSGSEATAQRELSDQYRMATGQSRNNLISSGLGNSTASLYAQRGLESDRAKAALGITNSFAQQRANYLAQFGTGALNAQQQAMGIYGQFGNNYLSTLGQQQSPRMIYAPNVTQSNQSSTSTGSTLGGSSSASLSVPSVANTIGGFGPDGRPVAPTFLGLQQPTLPSTGNPFNPYTGTNNPLIPQNTYGLR